MNSFFASRALRIACMAMALFMAISCVTRISLLCVSLDQLHLGPSLMGSMALGLISDFAAACFSIIPWMLLILCTPKRLWTSRTGSVVLTGLIWIYLSALLFIATSEWFFWDEFGVRFNFIAVDYLVFTTEVIGNIQESYPMGWIFTGIFGVAAAITTMLRRYGWISWIQQEPTVRPSKWSVALLLCCLPIMSYFAYAQDRLPSDKNQYHNELAKNGSWSFFAAYRKMEIEYDQWYLTLPQNQAFERARRQLQPSSDILFHGDPWKRVVTQTQEPKIMNVITVCMESMSADLMSYAGNTKNLTPHLDQLAKESLFFRNLRATGTRTVRGMEALTTSLPPTPGQAIFYRPDGVNLQTSFQPFLSRGYDCAFIYGGHGQFDYMNRFFSTSGCRIVDLSTWAETDVTMKTVWGACDEDLFHKTIAEADRAHSQGQPFHYFCMTTSNHRPYDFPEGRILAPSHSGREAAVQYADWSVGHLIEVAKTKPWFAHTIFVICADHCASSAGKAELDASKYHIPAMIYAPQMIKPQEFSKLCSQVDIMPTVFGLLGWSYPSVGFGRNLLAKDESLHRGRAFISNYQKVAQLRDEQLAILKPSRDFSLYQLTDAKGSLQSLPADRNHELLLDTIANYQTAAWLYTHGKLQRPTESTEDSTSSE